MRTIGIILLILGIGLTIFTSAKFFTKEKVVDIGKVEISRDKPNKLEWSPILGVVVMAVGGLVLWQSSKR